MLAVSTSRSTIVWHTFNLTSYHMEQLPHVASGRGGVLRATAMPEICRSLSFGVPPRAPCIRAEAIATASDRRGRRFNSTRT